MQLIESVLTRSLCSALSFLLIGCATFEPTLHQQDLANGRVPTLTTAKEGLEISIEEFVSVKKSQQAFDENLAGYGVLPLLVRVENKTGVAYRLARTQMKASVKDETLPLLEGREAATQAGKDPSGRALGWTLATGPFALILAPLTLVGSSAHTTSVNHRMEEYFGTIEFPDALVRPNEAVAGFIYFKIPLRLEKLENLVVEVAPINDNNNQTLFYRFELPALEVEIPRELRERRPGGN